MRLAELPGTHAWREDDGMANEHAPLRTIALPVTIERGRTLLLQSPVRASILALLRKEGVMHRTITGGRGRVFRLLQEGAPDRLAQCISVEYDEEHDALRLTGLQQAAVTARAARDVLEQPCDADDSPTVTADTAAPTRSAPAPTSTSLEKLQEDAQREQWVRVALSTEARQGKPAALLVLAAAAGALKLGEVTPKGIPEITLLTRMVQTHPRLPIVTQLLVQGTFGEGPLGRFAKAMPDILDQVFGATEQLETWVAGLRQAQAAQQKTAASIGEKQQAVAVSGKAAKTMHQILAALEGGKSMHMVTALKDLDATLGPKQMQHIGAAPEQFAALQQIEKLVLGAVSPGAATAFGMKDKQRLTAMNEALHEACGSDTKSSGLAARLTQAVHTIRRQQDPSLSSVPPNVADRARMERDAADATRKQSDRSDGGDNKK